MAVTPGNPDEPLQVLKHDPVPGYPKAFAIAFAVMGLYLLLILFTSPGPATHGDHGGEDHGSHQEAGHEDTTSHSTDENEPAAH